MAKQPSKTKKYKLTQADIAKIFGYSSVYSFKNSSSKNRYLKGIEKLIAHIEEQIISKLSE